MKKEYTTLARSGYSMAIDEGADYHFAPSTLIIPQDADMMSKAQSLFAPSHTVSDNSTYSNLGCVSLSESDLDNCIASMNDFYINGGCGNMISGSFTTTTTTPITMPKFKKGDVIIGTNNNPKEVNGWIIEKGEKFYVQQADHDTYWLRVLYSTDGAQKDFSVKSSIVDAVCAIDGARSRRNTSTRFFPNLSHV